jgi:hypothetical protein
MRLTILGCEYESFGLDCSMLAGHGCLPATQRSNGDSRPNVVHERLGVVHRRLVSTIRCHDVLPIHDFYHGRVSRDLVLLGRAQLG